MTKLLQFIGSSCCEKQTKTVTRLFQKERDNVYLKESGGSGKKMLFFSTSRRITDRFFVGLKYLFQFDRILYCYKWCHWPLLIHRQQLNHVSIFLIFPKCHWSKIRFVVNTVFIYSIFILQKHLKGCKLSYFCANFSLNGLARARW